MHNVENVETLASINPLQRFQRIFADGLEVFIRKVYRPMLHVAIKYRYSTAAVFIVILMVLIGGGFVSFWGPVVGVILYFVMRDILGAYTETWLLWFGLMFMVLVMFKPEGLAGMWRDLMQRNRAEAPQPRLKALSALWK